MEDMRLSAGSIEFTALSPFVDEVEVVNNRGEAGEVA